MRPSDALHLSIATSVLPFINVASEDASMTLCLDHTMCFWKPSALLLAAAIVSACGGDAASPAIDTRSKIELGACPVNLSDPTVLCGTLTVAEDRGKPSSGLIGLRFFVFPAVAAATKFKDPVMYLQGGPGPILPVLAGASRDELQLPWRANRDVLLLNYRGFEGTLPNNMDCPELAPADGGFANQADVVAAARSCRDRLKAQGIDPLAYTTDAIARDLEDLRILLGAKRSFNAWNVLGTSYGTALAQAYVRDFPDHVRTLALDAPALLDVSVNATIAAGALEVSDVVASLCAAQPTCATAFPALKASFAAALLKLAAAPVTFNGVSIGVKEALTLVSGAVALEPKVAPLVMHKLSAGDIAGASLAAPNLFALALPTFVGPKLFGSVPFGASNAIRCADELGLPEQTGQLPIVAAGWPDAVTRATLAVSTLATDQALCKVWSEGAVNPDAKKRIVGGTLPVLITVGQLDDVTPPSLAATLRKRFTNSRPVVILAGKGHSTLEDNDPCTVALTRAFIDAPQTPLDTACSKGSGEVVFLTP
jgi:pimeloyl-ACP methyl ester carboxylesterase